MSVNITINGREYTVDKNLTVLEAAKKASIDIPTLCFLKGVNEISSCRICLVEIEGTRNLQASCSLKVREGMKIKTNSLRVRNALKTNLELIIANHNVDCLNCSRNKNCELQDLSERMGIKNLKIMGEKRKGIINENSPAITRDSTKCILCGRCVSACKNKVGVGALGFKNRGFKTEVSTSFDIDLHKTNCISCGQCIVSCPVGALKEKDEIEKVWHALGDKGKHVVVQTAPAIRAALGEIFDLEIGEGTTGRMVAALKMLGFDKVFDTNFAADLTIMEEAHELIGRFKNSGVFPMITSCSPGWINYVEKNYPEIIPNLSTCKSPHQMFGAILKTYYAETMNIDPNDIFVVSVMPCVAKKDESKREHLQTFGIMDVDAVITTRELGQMIKSSGINFKELKDESFDNPLGEYSGSGVIFGSTGGVMEAALRTAKDVLTGEEHVDIDYHDLRGDETVKEGVLKLGDVEIKVAVVHGIKNVKPLIKEIMSGESSYHFIEVMACPGGCVTGGGQPIKKAKVQEIFDIRKARAMVLYNEDLKMQNRKSHKNTQIQKLYKEFLGHPNSHKSHELLHTSYRKQKSDTMD